MVFVSHSSAQTEQIGRQLAARLYPGSVVALYGGLGMGKTAFVRGLASGLDVDAKEELRRALSEYRGSILLICHEPEFYDGLATKVVDCGEWSKKI